MSNDREWTPHTARPEPPEDLTGKVLASRFRLDARLTVTRISCVYKGHDLHGRADVCVKVLRSELGACWEERFRREGRILARLRHPNIAEFIDGWVTEDGLCYLVTALVDGRSLADACYEPGALELEEVWQVGLQVADALRCAHDLGVIHRDVKPSNILWTPSGVAKLIDFGIAKLQPNAALELTPVRHPTILGAVGTPGYIPPEAAEQVDARTDVFGLGRTLYRLLTRRSADEAPSGLQHTPEPLRRVVLAAMHADPASRIASAAEFRRRWLEAGERVWPRAATAEIELRAAPQLWPPPPDQVRALAGEVACAGVGADEPCTAAVPPRLFERRLELRHVLGSGRCGQTWRAYHHLLGRDVAVKIVPRELAQGDIVAGLCREAMALDKLSHRAFPRVLECDYTADGTWYIVEEFIEGEALSDTFSRAPLDPLTAVEIVGEIAEALAEAHARGVLHGDIKGSNLILARTLPPRPRVIDLSECRLEQAFFAATDQRYAPSPVHRVEAAGTRGHPDFAAPELLRGERKSAASDVYALGVVLFILLTGRRNGAKVVREILADGPPEAAGERLRQVVVSRAPELEDTFIAAEMQDILAAEPERRPSMAELCEKLRVEAEALRDLRNPAPARLAARPTRAARPIPAPAPPARGHRPAVWLGAGALALATVWLSLQLTRPTAPVSEPAREASPAEPAPAPLVATASRSGAPASAPAVPPPQPATREEVQAAVDARRPDILARCSDVPPRLTLAIDVGPRVELAEVQHVEVDPSQPLDSCLRAIVAGLDLPPSDTTRRHVITLEMRTIARR
jgi:serine/threonine protein kinase